MLPEKQGSFRSLSTTRSLGRSARLGSFLASFSGIGGPSMQALQPEVADEAPAKTRRRWWPWGKKPKAGQDIKPAEQVGVEEVCCPHGSAADP